MRGCKPNLHGTASRSSTRICERIIHKKGNIPLPVATARHFCFRLLHDRYGLPYSVIAQRAGMNVSSVIKKVRKVRLMVFTDVIYRKVDIYINEKLEINNE